MGYESGRGGGGDVHRDRWAGDGVVRLDEHDADQRRVAAEEEAADAVARLRVVERELAMVNGQLSMVNEAAGEEVVLWSEWTGWTGWMGAQTVVDGHRIWVWFNQVGRRVMSTDVQGLLKFSANGDPAGMLARVQAMVGAGGAGVTPRVVVTVDLASTSRSSSLFLSRRVCPDAVSPACRRVRTLCPDQPRSGLGSTVGNAAELYPMFL